MLPPTLVAICFLIAVVSSLAAMAYMVWRDSKPSDFFNEAVSETYDLELEEDEIAAYYTLKDKLQEQYAPESIQEADEPADEGAPPKAPWSLKVPLEHRGIMQKALLKRLIACIDKLDRVQREKPGSFKLWQSKLVSERYWSSLLDAEKMVSQEIESCVAEAQEIGPGWRQTFGLQPSHDVEPNWHEHVFMQAVQFWRMQKQQMEEKKAAKQAVVAEKKEVKKEEKKKEVDARQEIEDKIRQEKLAQKMMEKLLAEEEKAEKGKAKSKAAPAAPKSKSKKK